MVSSEADNTQVYLVTNVRNGCLPWIRFKSLLQEGPNGKSVHALKVRAIPLKMQLDVEVSPPANIIKYIVACQRGGVSNEQLGQRQDTESGP